MAISINPVLPVLAAQEVGGTAPELVLQPGSVVNAQVLKVLSADLVRIAIASLSIDVLSEIPLRRARRCSLRCRRRKDGVRLAVVGQGGDAAAASGDAVTLSPEALVDVAVTRPTIVAPRSVLTPLERAAVSVAAQTAATEQDSLAPLFANLGAAASSASLPPKLQQAIAQVLAQQTSLDQNLGGDDIKTAFQKSGLFLEASLATGSVPPSGVSDLKAALIVLRQTLQSALGADGTTTAQAAPAAEQAGPQTAAAPGLASNLASGLEPAEPSALDVQEILLPQARLPVAEDIVQLRGGAPSALAAALEFRTERGSHAEPAAGSAAGARRSRAACGNPEGRSRRRRDRSHQHAAAAVSRRAAGGPAGRITLDRATCAALRRPRIICSTTPMPRSRGKPCCRSPRCRTVSTPQVRRSTRRRRAGISKFRS